MDRADPASPSLASGLPSTRSRGLVELESHSWAIGGCPVNPPSCGRDPALIPKLLHRTGIDAKRKSFFLSQVSTPVGMARHGLAGPRVLTKRKGGCGEGEVRVLGLRRVTARLHSGGHGSELEGQLPLRSLIAVCHPVDRQLEQRHTDEACGRQQDGKQTTNRMSRQLETTNHFS